MSSTIPETTTTASAAFPEAGSLEQEDNQESCSCCSSKTMKTALTVFAIIAAIAAVGTVLVFSAAVLGVPATIYLVAIIAIIALGGTPMVFIPLGDGMGGGHYRTGVPNRY